MHNSCTEQFADGPRAKDQVCKFQNLEGRSKNELQYVCITNAQRNLTLAQSCHQTRSACKRKPKRLTLLSGYGGTPPLPSSSSPTAIISQQTHNISPTSLQRRCNVRTLQRRCNDVVRTLCVCWDGRLPRDPNGSC